MPYWLDEIAPVLNTGETVLVAAHGNSLRAIAKHLFGLSESGVVGLEIPTGNPLAIALDADLAPRSAAYLDPKRAQPLPMPG
jgi:2,3-bisphosphoglycerate-dependent phosphoglycerate mutase